MTVNYTELGDEKLEFIAVAEENEIGNGERLFIEIDDFSIVIFNIAGQFFAIADLCSHDNGPLGDGELDVEARQVACPRHGARFDIRSGKADTVPAIIDIPAYPVRVVDGSLEIGIPID
ncbi:non-heme iron oxygenase ferredoxin subunit [Chloroflexota bacterium]